MAPRTRLYTDEEEDFEILSSELNRKTDIIIPIIGHTGVGKSTFINNLLGQNETPALTNDGFETCTKEIRHYFFKVPDKYKVLKESRLVIVDTPGFDDTYTGDGDILRRIGAWLHSSYGDNMRVGGFVYLYSIFTTRMSRECVSSLATFKKLCGEDGLSKVILGTTKWSLCPVGTGARRENELRDNFWREILKCGSQMYRVYDDPPSVWKVIDNILEQVASERRRDLEIQKEIMEKWRSIPPTREGKDLQKRILDLLEEEEKARRKNRVRMAREFKGL